MGRPIRAAAAGKTLTARLTKLPTQLLTPQYGTSAWLQAAVTTDDESIAWVATFTTDKAIRKAWDHVLTWRNDPSGRLATLAHDVVGNDLDVNARIVESAALPIQVRQVSARRLLAARASRLSGLTYGLLRDADESYVIEHLGHRDIPEHDLLPVMRRDDLTPRMLDADVEARTRLVRTENGTSYAPLGEFQFAPWLATHPSATSTHRAHAAALADSVRVPLVGQVVRAMDDGGIAAGGAALPVTTTTRAALNTNDGIERTVHAALREYLPPTFDRTAAAILTALAADFPGTLGELLTTAAAVAAA